MLTQDKNGDWYEATYDPDFINFMEENPRAKVYDAMAAFKISKRYAYKLMAKWEQEQEFDKNPEEKLLEAYQNGFENGYNKAAIAYSAIGILSTEVLANSGINITDLLRDFTSKVTGKATRTTTTTPTAQDSKEAYTHVQGYS